MFRFLIAFLVLSSLAPSLCRAGKIPVVTVKKQADGVELAMQPGVMRLQVWSDRVIRVTYAPAAPIPDLKSLSVVTTPSATQWQFHDEPSAVVLETKSLQASVDKKSGAIAFYDSTHQLILEESDDAGKEFSPATTKSVTGTSATQSFILGRDEAIYGLGQHRQGTWDYRGTKVHLQQRNMEVALPVLYSSKGYGVLWDNPSITDVSVGAEPYQSVVRWSSESGDSIDYYFIFGPGADQVIQSYRQLTGAAPMMGKWAWGYWQSRERYKTQDELLGVAREYRKRGIPIDGMIQDWQYWNPKPWGSHAFGDNFPDPDAMTRELHENNFHLLISVWPKFDQGSSNYDELDGAGLLYPPIYPNVFPKGQAKWYDAFNAEARKVYWRQMSQQLFAKGIDGWWLDGSEPELGGKWGELRDLQTGAGPGYKVFNAYPLMTTTAVYEGQRAQTSNQRVFILTRSAYAGQQRNASVTWSGDIRGDWQTLRRQIPAGLNFVLSGIPYWNTDIGGFFCPKPTDEKYRELYARWFQFGAFCPMFRSHGSNVSKEMWEFGSTIEPILIKFDKLRYRLLPYIYSIAWRVTSDGYTMMRPLVMDFPGDSRAIHVNDEFLFGPSILVCPVTQEGASSRKVYLPGAGDAGGWYDFWTGKHFESAQEIDAAAPLDTMPLYVRAGTILPMGPQVQHAMEKADPIELRIYAGADASFTLYEDDGNTYDYEKGVYATIPLTWNDKSATLTIGPRSGEFPGMLKERTFRVVFVKDDHGAGSEVPDAVDQQIKFTGERVTVNRFR